MTQAEKVYENRLRRMAERQGLALRKSRRRDPLALDYGAYWLVDMRSDATVTPEEGVSLEDIEKKLTRSA